MIVFGKPNDRQLPGQIANGPYGNDGYARPDSLLQFFPGCLRCPLSQSIEVATLCTIPKPVEFFRCSAFQRQLSTFEIADILVGDTG